MQVESRLDTDTIEIVRVAHGGFSIRVWWLVLPFQAVAGCRRLSELTSGPIYLPPGICPTLSFHRFMDMREGSRQMIDKVELMLANARLRDELEPYRDESIDTPHSRMTLQTENEYLASMLAWERAPALPIADWFSPRLELSPPDSIDDKDLSQLLENAIEQLYSKRIVLRCTDHLSDRELYTIIFRDILPTCEKKVEVPGKVLEWLCVNDTETWLRYYADAVERRRYQEEHDVEIPRAEEPPFQRKLPGN